VIAELLNNLNSDIVMGTAQAASRRAQDVRGSLLLSFYAIAAGSGLLIAVMLVTGMLTADIAVLVPVGSMIIANAMNACALGLVWIPE
jgi:putative ABC transport system permease protein